MGGRSFQRFDPCRRELFSGKAFEKWFAIYSGRQSAGRSMAVEKGKVSCPDSWSCRRCPVRLGCSYFLLLAISNRKGGRWMLPPAE